MTWTLDNIDKWEADRVVFPRERLIDLSIDDLRKLAKRHVESAYLGNFWSFQICNSVYAHLVFNRGVKP